MLSELGHPVYIWLLIVLDGKNRTHVLFRLQTHSRPPAVPCCTGYGWQLGWLFQCCWQFVFVQQTHAGMVICYLLLAAALSAFALTLRRLLLLQQQVHLSTTSFALFVIPTSINAAWLSVATCLGALIAAQDAMGLSWAGAQRLSIVFAVGLTLVGLFMVLAWGDYAYGATLMWAFWAVFDSQDWEAVQIMAAGGIVLLGLSGCARAARSRKPSQQQQLTAGGEGEGSREQKPSRDVMQQSLLHGDKTQQQFSHQHAPQQ